MKKLFSIYSIIWAICLAIFNAVVFITPNEICGVSKFDASFWVGYIFIVVAFVMQIICAFCALSAKNINKIFYKFPLISISYAGLIAMLIVGTVFMTVPKLPEWIAIIICAIVLSINVIAIIKATATAVVVNNIDTKIEGKTFFIKKLISDAQNVMGYSENDELCADAKMVYEAIRYSDPITNESLLDIDSQIRKQFDAFAYAVKSGDVELSKETSKELVRMIETRNHRGKISK